MGLSLAHLTVLDARLEDVLPAAAAGGFDGVALRIFSGTNPPYVRQVVGDRSTLRTLRDQAEDLGLVIDEVESFVLRPGVDRDLWSAGLDAAAALGAHHLLTVGFDPEPSRALDDLGWLAAEAEQRGLRIGLEFIPYSQITTLGAARDLLRQVGRPSTGLIIDTLHLARSGARPADLADLAPEEYAFVQLADAQHEAPAPADLATEARTGRLLPGDGDLPLAEVLAAVPEGIPLSLEAPTRDLAGLAPVERARIAGARTRTFLAQLAPTSRTTSTTEA